MKKKIILIVSQIVFLIMIIIGANRIYSAHNEMPTSQFLRNNADTVDESGMTYGDDAVFWYKVYRIATSSILLFIGTGGTLINYYVLVKKDV